MLPPSKSPRMDNDLTAASCAPCGVQGVWAQYVAAHCTSSPTPPQVLLIRTPVAPSNPDGPVCSSPLCRASRVL